MRMLEFKLDPDRDHGDPTLICYLQNRMPGEAPQHFASVLVCPGGGYTHLSPREGEPIALAFAARGFQTFVLNYSLKPVAVYPKPLLDAARAMNLIRAHAEEWDLDPNKIAMGGFSAGGHLTAALSTFWNDPIITEAGIDAEKARPNAAFLGYAVVSAGEDESNPGPFAQRLLQENTADPSLIRLAYIPLHVGAQNPPTFIWHTAADQTVPVVNALRMAGALSANKIPFEVHIFPNGKHGLALANAHTCNGDPEMIVPEVEQWMDLCCDWLKRTFA